MSKSESLVFLSGKRTPFGANGGALKDVNPTELTRVAAEKALTQAQVPATEVDHVILGNVLHSAADSIYTPRHVGLRLGVPEGVPALGINRLCGSGFQVVVEAYHQMLAGDSKVVLVGGVENMSMSPYLVRGARWGLKMGHTPIQDMMMEALFDSYAQLPMGMTAENLGTQYGISRSQADDFAFRSQSRHEEARKKGYFAEEVVPFDLGEKKGVKLVLEQDEHPKPGTPRDKLGSLKPVFKQEGLITAANASGVVDGAAAMVVSTEKEAQRRGIQPLGRLVGYGIRGCDPKIMGIGPVPAIQAALKQSGMRLDQMDLIEVNEAFAPQTLAVAQELGIPDEKLNVNGGAIAVGHPLAASGVRIILHILYELRRRIKRYGIGSACIGGGQGIALIVESMAG